MQVDPVDVMGPLKSCRLLVAGVGGVGCRVLQHGLNGEGPGPDTLALHTDTQALESSRADRRLQVGAALTRGMSTGGDAALGRRCVDQDEAVIRDQLSDYDLVFFVSGLGGGTGTGATPRLVQVAREQGAFTLCLVTLPFSFEGNQRLKQADMGLASLKEQADAVICFPNQRLQDMLGEDQSLAHAFEVADQYLVESIRALWELLQYPGMINLDFMDIRNILMHSHGTFTLATVERSGKNRVQHLVEAVLASPLLDRGSSIAKARGLLIGICGGPLLKLQEINHIVGEITKVTRQEIKLFVGTCIRPAMASSIAVTILASEQWIADTAEPATGEGDAAESGQRKMTFVQGEIDLGSRDKGRFKGIEPTLVDGEDLDIPTYLRRGIKISGA